MKSKLTFNNLWETESSTSEFSFPIARRKKVAEKSNNSKVIVNLEKNTGD